MLRRLGIGLVALFACGVALAWYVGGKLTEPAARVIGPPPQSLGASSVEFASTSGSRIRGWLSKGEPGRGAVLLLHGVRSSRIDMVQRAQFLRSRGYSVLLIDLQAHGESPGTRITFGDLESRDASAAIAWLRNALPGERIGAIGVSLGAAALVLAEKPVSIDAVVIESMYPTIRQAVEDRLKLRLGEWGAWGAPVLIAQIAPRIGVDPDRLRPIDEIGKLGAPLFLIHGALDAHTGIDEARAVFAAAAEPKALWVVDGAAHVNLHRFARAEYEERVSEFFAKNLGRLPQ
jgi:uncharacterized protein